MSTQKLYHAPQASLHNLRGYFVLLHSTLHHLLWRSSCKTSGFLQKELWFQQEFHHEKSQLQYSPGDLGNPRHLSKVSEPYMECLHLVRMEEYTPVWLLPKSDIASIRLHRVRAKQLMQNQKNKSPRLVSHAHTMSNIVPVSIQQSRLLRFRLSYPFA